MIYRLTDPFRISNYKNARDKYMQQVKKLIKLIYSELILQKKVQMKT